MAASGTNWVGIIEGTFVIKPRALHPQDWPLFSAPLVASVRSRPRRSGLQKPSPARGGNGIRCKGQLLEPWQVHFALWLNANARISSATPGSRLRRAWCPIFRFYEIGYHSRAHFPAKSRLLPWYFEAANFTLIFGIHSPIDRSAFFPWERSLTRAVPSYYLLSIIYVLLLFPWESLTPLHNHSISDLFSSERGLGKHLHFPGKYRKTA